MTDSKANPSKLPVGNGCRVVVPGDHRTSRGNLTANRCGCRVFVEDDARLSRDTQAARAYVDTAAQQRARVEELEAEVERLRRGLQQIVDICDTPTATAAEVKASAEEFLSGTCGPPEPEGDGREG